MRLFFVLLACVAVAVFAAPDTKDVKPGVKKEQVKNSGRVKTTRAPLTEEQKKEAREKYEAKKAKEEEEHKAKVATDSKAYLEKVTKVVNDSGEKDVMKKLKEILNAVPASVTKEVHLMMQRELREQREAKKAKEEEERKVKLAQESKSYFEKVTKVVNDTAEKDIMKKIKDIFESAPLIVTKELSKMQREQNQKRRKEEIKSTKAA